MNTAFFYTKVRVLMLIEPIVHHVMENVLAFPDEPGADVPVPPSPGRAYFLYVHIPFCKSLCPYCSFHRVQFKPEKATPYFRALNKEIRYYHSLGYQFSEVYVGGGTPTICPEELTNTLALLRQLYNVRRISVETNPDHLNPVLVAKLRDAGVNRLSVGVGTGS